MRTLGAAFRGELESVFSGEVIVCFVTIDHTDLLVPIRVNSDIVDYVYNGDTYTGAAFAISLLSDNEQAPRLQASINNVDRIIGETVLALTSAPRIKIELFAKSDFTDAIPRVASGTPTVEYSAPHLFLRNVSCDAMALSGDVVGYDFSTEPWPAIRSTPDKLPGLNY